ncbi:hypothetical protein PFJ87_02g00870 [Encephalitozoon hellem]|uniref:Uncharacterized protein n=1 Tax=Encephalitozoon hellem TaxID=27973 RepID=A0A9Q9F7R4_ENCHE|nr:hypothetical protein GPU96_02g03050 [Encephalitozoon hellem]WEL38049.1 hypothetical protein PFJ87_02g00870 [Encephalitozoon hellem]
MWDVLQIFCGDGNLCPGVVGSCSCEHLLPAIAVLVNQADNKDGNLFNTNITEILAPFR